LWPSEDIDPAEQENEILWATWGGGESILMFAGRYFFVASTSSNNVPGIVTWLTPNGTRRPICSFEVEHVDRSVSFVRDDAALCSAVAHDELPAIAWRKKPYSDINWSDREREFLLATGLGGAGLPDVDVANIDINNDGALDTLGRAQYASGAACGSTLSRLMLLTEDSDHLKAGPINDAPMGLITSDGKPVEIISYRSHSYVRAAIEQTPALFRVTSDAVQTECVFHDQPISRVKTLYPLDGPVRDPANQEPR
jgi:hypothetical protein